MKVLLVSDLRYRLRQYDWLARAAADAEVVVIAGDLLDIRSAVLRPALGNHDLDSRDAQGEKVASWLARIRDERVQMDGESVL